jgi:peptide chain release factor
MSLWLQLSSGRGPVECQWVVAQVLRLLVEEAAARGVSAELLEASAGEQRDTLLSALVSLEGAEAAALSASWVGTVQWIGRSPFRPQHKRQNWFIGVERFALPERPTWSERDLLITTLRASGPGGQHVNKTESAVRIVHQPTGLSVVAREERSQQQNKRLALARLAALLDQSGDQAARAAAQERWDQHNALVRGNPVRVYAGPEFRKR